MNKQATNQQQLKSCPECGQEYAGYPSISRKDNRTAICSDCGIQEAKLAWIRHGFQADLTQPQQDDDEEA